MRRHPSRGVALDDALVAFAKANRDAPTLTAYIAGGMHDPADRRHWRVALKRDIAQCRRRVAAGPSVERNGFDAANAALLDAIPSDEAAHSTPGFAVFATATGAVLTLPLESPPDASVTWQAGPRIAPCLAVATLRPAIVAIADRKHAALYRFERGGVSVVEHLDVEPVVETGMHMGSAPRRGFHTGTRGTTQRDSAARKLRESRERHAADVAMRVAALAGADLDIVIGGVEETAALIAAALPTSLDGRVVRDDSIGTGGRAVDVLAGAERALATLEGARQVDLAGTLLDAVGSNGHAAAGIVDVIRALERRAVDHLIVSPSLIARHPDALDQMVQESLAERAVIEVAYPAAAGALDRFADGIVARLRFAVPTTRHARPRRTARRKPRAATV